MNEFHYSYHQDFDNVSDLFNQALPILIGIMIIGLVILFSIYILQGLGLMKLAQRNNINHSWLAFIPVANAYIYGKVAFEDKIKTFALLGTQIIYCLSVMNSYFNYSTSYATNNPISSAVLVISIIFSLYASYQIFKKYSDKAVMMLIFSILSCGFLNPVFLFAIRNNEKRIDVK